MKWLKKRRREKLDLYLKRLSFAEMYLADSERLGWCDYGKYLVCTDWVENLPSKIEKLERKLGKVKAEKMTKLINIRAEWNAEINKWMATYPEDLENVLSGKASDEHIAMHEQVYHGRVAWWYSDTDGWMVMTKDEPPMKKGYHLIGYTNGMNIEEEK